MGQKNNSYGTYATSTEILQQQSNQEERSDLLIEKSFIGEQLKHNIDSIY